MRPNGTWITGFGAYCVPCNTPLKKTNVTPQELICPKCAATWDTSSGWTPSGSSPASTWTTAPKPKPIPPGHGRVYQMAAQANRVECSCPRPVSHFTTPSMTVLGCLVSQGGCGAEWDYQTVQNAAIGTDLPATYPNVQRGSAQASANMGFPQAAPSLGVNIVKSYNQLGMAAVYKGATIGWQCEDCNALRTGKSALMASDPTVHSVECIGCKSLWDDRDLAAVLGASSVPTTPAQNKIVTLPIVYPYARAEDLNGTRFLKCSCKGYCVVLGGSPITYNAAGHMEVKCDPCQLAWDYNDVQAASVGDLLPGTPIGQQSQNHTAFTSTVYNASGQLAGFDQSWHCGKCYGSGQSVLYDAGVLKICPLCRSTWDQALFAATPKKATAGTSMASLLKAGFSGMGNYFGPPATPPLFDPFDAPAPETEPSSSGKKCWDCGGDWCEALDAWFGEKIYAGTCAPCRSKRGVK